MVDPAGAWLTGWRAAFAHFEIPVLRSHMLAHPDPRIELALVEAEMAYRRGEEDLDQEGEEETRRRNKKTKGGRGKGKGAGRADLFGWVGVFRTIDSFRLTDN